MNSARLVWVVLMVGAVGLVGGCKSVETTFVNNTAEPLDLEISGPGSGVGHLGTIPSNGQLRTLIKVSPVWLPAMYELTAGSYSQTFSIASDSKERITVNIPGDAVSKNPPWRLQEGQQKTGEVPVVYEP